MLLYPGVSINRTRQRGGAMPVWGDSQRYSIDVSDTTWGSDVDFGIFQAQNVWIRTLGEKIVLWRVAMWGGSKPIILTVFHRRCVSSPGATAVSVAINSVIFHRVIVTEN